MTRRLRGAARVAVLSAGLALAAAPVVFHRAPARAADAPGANLGGYKASSASAGFDLVYNDGSEAEMTIPTAQSSFITGSGHALSADVYPGPVGGNPGATLSQLFGADLPQPVVDAVAPLQDNAKAEAFSGGPNDASFPPGGPTQALSDTAHADDATATAHGVAASTSGSFTSSATSTTTVAASSVTTTATSTISDVTIAGIIHIGSVTSTATASSDGTTGKATGSTTVKGFDIAGQAVSIVNGAVTLGPTHVPLDTAALLNPALKGLGLSIAQTPADHIVKGALASEHAGALTISINPPNNGGNTFTLILGGAQAQAQASPAFDASGAGSGSVPPAAASAGGASGTGGAAAVDTGAPVGDTSSASALPSSDGQSAFVPPTTAPRRTTLPTGILATPAADYRGLSAGLLVLGLIVAGAAAFGMGKVPDDVLAEKPSVACPLERRTP